MLTEFIAQRRVHEVALQAFEHGGFERIAVDGMASQVPLLRAFAQPMRSALRTTNAPPQHPQRVRPEKR